jgi:hypothetical protein
MVRASVINSVVLLRERRLQLLYPVPTNGKLPLATTLAGLATYRGINLHGPQARMQGPSTS